MANALDRPEQLPLAGARSSGGIYAPTLRHHDGLFWLVTTNVSTGGHVIYTAEDPRGPWSDPVAIDGAAGIDPDLAWDAEGTCWLTYSELGRRRLRRRERPDQAGPPGPAQRPPARAAAGAVVGDRACSSPRRRTSTRSTAPGTCSSPRAAPARATRSRSRAGPRRRGRSRAARTTRSSATAAPTTRCRTPATPTSCRRPTARGGWSCSASAAPAPSPRSTCSGARPSSRRCAGSTAGPRSSRCRWSAGARTARSATTSRRPSSGPSGSRCARAPTTRCR